MPDSSAIRPALGRCLRPAPPAPNSQSPRQILKHHNGGKSYPGAPTLGFVPMAGPDELGAIHAIWRTLEAFGYSVRPVLDYDYIALPDVEP